MVTVMVMVMRACYGKENDGGEGGGVMKACCGELVVGMVREVVVVVARLGCCGETSGSSEVGVVAKKVLACDEVGGLPTLKRDIFYRELVGYLLFFHLRYVSLDLVTLSLFLHNTKYLYTYF